METLNVPPKSSANNPTITSLPHVSSIAAPWGAVSRAPMARPVDHASIASGMPARATNTTVKEMKYEERISAGSTDTSMVVVSQGPPNQNVGIARS